MLEVVAELPMFALILHLNYGTGNEGAATYGGTPAASFKPASLAPSAGRDPAEESTLGAEHRGWGNLCRVSRECVTVELDSVSGKVCLAHGTRLACRRTEVKCIARPAGEITLYEIFRCILDAPSGACRACSDVRDLIHAGPILVYQSCESDSGKPQRGDQSRQRTFPGSSDRQPPSHGGLGVHAQSGFEHGECSGICFPGWR